LERITREGEKPVVLDLGFDCRGIEKGFSHIDYDGMMLVGV